MKRFSFFWSITVMVCGFVACRQPVDQVQASAITDVSSYFWTGSSPRMLFDTNGKLTNTLSFSGPAPSFSVQDNNVTLQCQIWRDSVKASGFSIGSVIDLDSYSFFSAQDTAVTIPAKMSAAVIADSGYYAATDHGIWSHSSGAWLQDSPNAPAINHFAYDTYGKMLYAVTVSGQIMQKSLASSGNPWTTITGPPGTPGPFNAMIFYNGSLFVARTGSSGVSVLTYGSWSSPAYSIGEITALLPYPGSYPILAGTAQGKVYAMSSTGGLSPAAPVLNCGSRVNSLLAFNGGVAAGTNTGLYKSAHGSDLWRRINTMAPIQSIAQRVGHYLGGGKSDPDSLCFISNGGVFWVDTSGAPIPARAIPTASTALGFVFESGTVNSTVVTPFSLCNSTGMILGGWIPATSDTIPAAHPESRGDLLLLRPDRTNNNDSWHAGTLVTYKNWQSYSITGRVMEHLDTLQITNGVVTKSYPDVLEVRYAHELSGAQPQSDLVPYWVVYYQKGLGPIMFDKQEAGHLTRRQIQ